MFKYYKTVDNKLTEIPAPEKDCWVNVSPPFNPENLKKLSEVHNIPFDYLIDSLDIDERSRFEIEDNIELVVLKIPIVNEQDSTNDSIYITIPVGIVILPDMILTISAYDSPVIQDFIDGKVKNIDAGNKNHFLLKIFERSVNYFLQYLNDLNNKRTIFEKTLIKSMKNENLFSLMNIEKSLVYFVTSLRSNELLMMKLNRSNSFDLTEHQLDFLEDIIVDNSQALEMANVYTNILSSTMDTFASIISNNLNVVMRRLTSVTIILMLPTLMASLYGMNVELPFAKHPMAFTIITIVSTVMVGGAIWYFMKKKWF